MDGIRGFLPTRPPPPTQPQLLKQATGTPHSPRSYDSHIQPPPEHSSHHFCLSRPRANLHSSLKSSQVSQRKPPSFNLRNVFSGLEVSSLLLIIIFSAHFFILFILKTHRLAHQFDSKAGPLKISKHQREEEGRRMFQV